MKGKKIAIGITAAVMLTGSALVFATDAAKAVAPKPDNVKKPLGKLTCKLMKKWLFLFMLSVSFFILQPTTIQAAVLLNDHFIGTRASSVNWHIPTWVSPTDGTFIGRTQLRCTQNSSLPAASSSNALITVQTYNPTGFSFYGTDLISNKSFPLGKGIAVTVRAKMNATMRGVVGGIFLYELKPGSRTLHDEIDFELLTNVPNSVQTNIYNSEPLGAGHPKFIPYASGTINTYHTYQLQWLPNRVSWFIDGKLVRTSTTNVPKGPMHLHLNAWVPGAEWAKAYNSLLQPTTSSRANRVFPMAVDLVTVSSLP